MGEKPLNSPDIGAKIVIPCHYDMFEFNTADPADEFIPNASASAAVSRLQLGERFSSRRSPDEEWKIAGINFDHMHMGDNLRMAFNHSRVEIVGICDEQPERMAQPSPTSTSQPTASSPTIAVVLRRPGRPGHPLPRHGAAWRVGGPSRTFRLHMIVESRSPRRSPRRIAWLPRCGRPTRCSRSLAAGLVRAARDRQAADRRGAAGRHLEVHYHAATAARSARRDQG